MGDAKLSCAIDARQVSIRHAQAASCPNFAAVWGEECWVSRKIRVHTKYHIFGCHQPRIRCSAPRSSVAPCSTQVRVNEVRTEATRREPIVRERTTCNGVGRPL